MKQHKFHFLYRIFFYLKKYKLYLLRKQGASIGKVILHGDFHYEGYAHLLTIKDYVHINQGVKIQGSAPIMIEEHVHLSYDAKLIVGGLILEDSARQKHIAKPITLKTNCWIGAGAIILGGVSVGENAVVGAGAVVTRDVPPNTLVAGVPAKIIKTFTEH